MGEEIAFAGTVEDEDQPAEELVVSWESSVDGALGGSAPTPGGSVDLAIATLSAGRHVVTMLVEDERGARCADDVALLSDAPPEVLITYALAYTSWDNRSLASLAGVSPSSLTTSSATISTTMSVVDPTHPLMTSLPGTSWTAVSFNREQGHSGSWSSALLSGASIVAGTSGQSTAIAYEGAAWNGVFLTGMLEYSNSYADSRQLLYNSLIWASGRVP